MNFLLTDGGNSLGHGVCSSSIIYITQKDVIGHGTRYYREGFLPAETSDLRAFYHSVVSYQSTCQRGILRFVTSFTASSMFE